jgi:hypothetical protein
MLLQEEVLAYIIMWKMQENHWMLWDVENLLAKKKNGGKQR